MADLHGRVSKFAVSTNGSSYTDVGGVQDVSWPKSRDVAEVTDKDSGGNKQYLSGHADSTISVNGNYDEADAGLDIVSASYLAGSTIYFRLRPGGNASGVGKEEIAQGIITSYEISSPNQDKISYSFEVQVTGGVTRQTQP